ncbi:MAG: DUF3341 domain-containing protein [Candidatus Latescibacteria bacterium]|nr:DUF3341 domain-containing protein [Candidatus Latescibacterota bacterium]
MAENLYGLLAEFDGPDELLKAARDAYAEGYRKMDAYSPMPIHDLSESMGYDKHRVPTIVLICAILGACSGFGLQYWVSVIDYPLNVGGRPLLSWPSFIPVTFELGVLFSAFGALIGMLILNGLPRPYHPVFNVPNFERASGDGFFLCIEAEDPKFDISETRSFLESLKAKKVDDVEP